MAGDFWGASTVERAVHGPAGAHVTAAGLVVRQERTAICAGGAAARDTICLDGCERLLDRIP